VVVGSQRPEARTLPVVQRVGAGEALHLPAQIRDGSAVVEAFLVGQGLGTVRAGHIGTPIVDAEVIGAGVVVGIAVAVPVTTQGRKVAVGGSLLCGNESTHTVDTAITRTQIIVITLGIDFTAIFYSGITALVVDTGIFCTLLLIITFRTGHAASGNPQGHLILTEVSVGIADADGAVVPVITVVIVAAAVGIGLDVAALAGDAGVRGAGVPVAAVPRGQAAVLDERKLALACIQVAHVGGAGIPVRHSGLSAVQVIDAARLNSSVLALTGPEIALVQRTRVVVVADGIRRAAVARRDVLALVVHALVQGIDVRVVALPGRPAALGHAQWVQCANALADVGVAVLDGALRAIHAVGIGLAAVREIRVRSIAAHVADASVHSAGIAVAALVIGVAAVCLWCEHTVLVLTGICGAEVSVVAVAGSAAATGDTGIRASVVDALVHGAGVIIGHTVVLSGSIAVTRVGGMYALELQAVVQGVGLAVVPGATRSTIRMYAAAVGQIVGLVIALLVHTAEIVGAGISVVAIAVIVAAVRRHDGPVTTHIADASVYGTHVIVVTFRIGVLLATLRVAVVHVHTSVRSGIAVVRGAEYSVTAHLSRIRQTGVAAFALCIHNPVVDALARSQIAGVDGAGFCIVTGGIVLTVHAHRVLVADLEVPAGTFAVELRRAAGQDRGVTESALVLPSAGVNTALNRTGVAIITDGIPGTTAASRHTNGQTSGTRAVRDLLPVFHENATQHPLPRRHIGKHEGGRRRGGSHGGVVHKPLNGPTGPRELPVGDDKCHRQWRVGSLSGKIGVLHRIRDVQRRIRRGGHGDLRRLDVQHLEEAVHRVATAHSHGSFGAATERQHENRPQE
jgi:hypothetical protein